MDLGNLIGDVLKAARTATAVIPGLQGASVAIGVGERLIGIIDDLTDSAPDPRTQEQMQRDRRALAAAVSAKAERTADRFDG